MHKCAYNMQLFDVPFWNAFTLRGVVMRFLSRVLLLCAWFAMPVALTAEQTASSQNLKYFIVEGVPNPAVLKAMVENPADPTAGAEALVSGIEGAKLIGYYLLAGKTQNLAIIAVPDTYDAAAVTWQRMGTGLMSEMNVYEVIPADQFKGVLDQAKALNEKDQYLKE